MDSITQAALGAGIVGAVLGRQVGRRALLAGAVLGTLPDMDVVIRYADPLTGMISHRGFSHSVFVLSAAAVVLTVLAASRLCRADKPNDDAPSRLRLFMAIWLALITHPLLDAFTAYGTQLFWPFKPTPTSWASIFIIDPFFTLPLLGAVLWTALRGHTPKRGAVLTGTLAWCVVYLGLSLVAKQLVETRARQQLQAAGHTVVETFSVPQPFSILLWRVVSRGADDTYHESIHGLLDGQAGESLQHPLGSGLLDGMMLPADNPPLTGLHWFSGGWLRFDEVDGALVGAGTTFVLPWHSAIQTPDAGRPSRPSCCTAPIRCLTAKCWGKSCGVSGSPRHPCPCGRGRKSKQQAMCNFEDSENFVKKYGFAHQSIASPTAP